MIVCSCNVVTDREIRRAVQAGASTLREVARSCRAGTSCGGCRPALKSIIREARAEGVAAPRLSRDPAELGLAAS